MSNIVEITKSIHLKKKEFYKGLPGKESLRYIEYYKGNKEYYKGNKGEEQLIKVEEKVKKTHRKNYKYYTGFKGQERLVKIKCFNDIIKYYKGSKNEEYLIKEEFPRLDIEYQFYNSRDIANLENLIKKNTSVIYIETPGTYTFEIIDIEEVVRVCKKYKLKSIIDNTWATALYFNPLKFGIDIVIEAVTKYISGHSDIMMGAVVANDENLINLQRWTRNSGTYVSPDDVYLSLRGLRTLPLRLKQSSENSFALAKYLETKKEVKKVIHPALTQHPEHERWKKYFNGSSGLFAIEFQDYITQTDVDRLADACEIFGIGASWGGYSSLLSTMNISENRHLKSSYVPKGEYLRIYAGSENIDDLINDLENGFKELCLK